MVASMYVCIYIVHSNSYILYIYYAPGCIRYRECTQAQLTEPSQANQASSTGRAGGGGGAEPAAATANPHHKPPRQPHPTSQALTTHLGPAYYKLLRVTLSFNSPTRYHSLHFLAFSASALVGEERRSGFLVVLKRSARLREAERSSGFCSRRPTSSPLFPLASASSPSLHYAAFPSSSSFSPVG
jgi:hypothetical protein